MPRWNGGVIGPSNTPTSEVASGVWSLAEVEQYTGAGTWPSLFSGTALRLDFDETTTLDSRISFTRATNGTYFDSAGVLRTAGSGVARFDHRLEGGVWVNKGLLIEEQRTNLCTRSEEFDLAFWEKQNTTVNPNTTTAPTNTTIADSLFETTTNSTHSITSASGASAINITSTSSNPTSISIFVKANGRDNIRFGLEQVASPFNQFFADINLTTQAIINTGNNGTSGVVLSASIQDVGNGWRRVSVSGYTTVSSANHILRIYLRDASLNFSYTGDTSKGVFLFGAQLELGAFPTSYIATTSATVTRNADDVEMTSTDFSDWYNASEGTIFTQKDFFNSVVNPTGGQIVWAVSDGTTNERIMVLVDGGPGFATPDFARFQVRDGAVTQADIYSPAGKVQVTAGTTYKTASVYKVNDFAISLDSNAPTTDTSGTLPTVNKLGIGRNATTNSYLNGHIAKFYYWNTRKSNAFLQSVTG